MEFNKAKVYNKLIDVCNPFISPSMSVITTYDGLHFHARESIYTLLKMTLSLFEINIFTPIPYNSLIGAQTLMHSVHRDSLTHSEFHAQLSAHFLINKCGQH